MLYHNMKRPGICRDYSGLDVNIIRSDQVYVGITQGCDVIYYMKRPGICRDYSGRWCYDIIWSGQVYVGITQGCDVMILYEAARYMLGLLRAVMLWYYKKRPGICRDYSGLWCYDIIRSDQVYVGITPGCDVMILYEATRYMSGLLRAVMLYNIIWSDQVYVRITPGCDVIYYKKRPGICRDYSGRWCYNIIWSGQVYVGITQGGDVIYYKKRPGICRDYSGLWCYDIIRSGQVYVGITPGCDVIYYMKRPGICQGLLRAVMLYYMKRPGICRDYSGLWCYIIWSGQVYVRITPGCDVMILYEAARYMSGITQGCDVMILYEAARYMSGLLRAVIYVM